MAALLLVLIVPIILGTRYQKNNPCSLILIISALMITNTSYGSENRPMIYLIPGQGSDYRVFKNLELDSTYVFEHISYTIPGQNMTLPEYARELSAQVDTTRPYVLIGVSLGGMIATEMSEFMCPEKTILISSAKCWHELPKRYQFQRNIPIYKIVSGKTAKLGAQFLQPIVEPDRNKEKALCKSMLKNKNPVFLKRSIKMILEWERTDYPDDIIHIHGNDDNTIPIRNVNYDYLVNEGSHMMVLTRGAEISKIINDVLKDE